MYLQYLAAFNNIEIEFVYVLFDTHDEAGLGAGEEGDGAAVHQQVSGDGALAQLAATVVLVGCVQCAVSLGLNYSRQSDLSWS